MEPTETVDLAIPSAWLSIVGTLVLMIAPPVALLAASEPMWRFFAVGAMSWAAALALKLALMKAPGLRNAVASGSIGAGAWGLFSGISELGFTAVLVRVYVMDATPVQIAAIGIGVASLEILYVLGLGIREHIRGQDPAEIERWIIGARQSHWVRNMLFIERLSATLGHVGTRGLICLAVAGHAPWLAALALVTFTVVDGIAVYGKSRKWNWCDPTVARRFYTVALLLGAADVALFAAVAASG